MTLSVTTVAPTLRLTTVTAVRAELGHPASDDAFVAALIDQSSSAIVAYCHRPFARETYTEILPGFGTIRLQMARTPIVSITALTIWGNVITDYGIEDADRGWIFARSLAGVANNWNRESFPWTVQSYQGLSGGGAFLDMGSPQPLQEEPAISASYTAGYILPSQFLTSVTVSADTTDDSFNDSAAAFPALVKAGDVVEVDGFATAANNARWLVTGTPTASKIPISGNLTTEAAGRTISVKFRPPSVHRPFDDVEKACIEAVKSYYSSRKDDSSIVEKQAGPMRIRYSENLASNPAGLPPVCVGLLRPWVRAA